MDARTSRLTNRYLQWTDERAAPPLRGSLGKAEEAAQVLSKRCTLARRRLGKKGATWVDLDALMEARQHLGAVVSLVESQSEVSKRIALSKAEDWAQGWLRWISRFDASIVNGASGQTLQRMKRRPETDARGRQLDILLMDGSCPASLDISLRKQTLLQQRRDESHAKDRAKHGGVLLDGTVGGLNRDYLRDAKKAAKERGQPGRMFLPWTDEATAVSCQAEHSELRRLVWFEHHYAPVPQQAIENMRKTRQARAQSLGASTYADHRFENNMVYPQPRKLVRQIHRARQTLRVESEAMLKAAQSLARLNDTDVPRGPLAPWDAYFCREHAESNTHVDLTKIFPWRETCMKVFSEIVAQCGWKYVRAPKTSGQGVWSLVHFHVENPATGQRSHLIYAPFRPKHKGHSYFAGVASDVINHWSAEGEGSRDNTVWITQTLDLNEKAYSLDDLRVLCHELGHAFHFSSMPGHGPDENTYLPEDITEIPSYLLEMYHRDPAVLARWASRKGPPAARRSRYWVNKLAWGADTAIEHQAGLRSAQMDLLAHLGTARPYADIAREVWADDGDRIHMEDDTWKRDFVWDTALACIDFTQTLPPSLVRRILTVPDHGRMDGAIVAETYQSFMEHVLIGGDTPKSAARNWRKWAGETFATSMGIALINHARQSARITRKATKALRKKVAKKKRSLAP